MEYFDVIRNLIPVLEEEEEHMKKAAHLIAESIINGGIIQAFGTGHSSSVAIEVSRRAGGLLAVKAVNDETFGLYERIEGAGNEFANYWDLREKDCVILISNSGRNPFMLELAMYVKSKNIPLIAVTALDVSKNTTSRDSSGKRLFELADVVLDNHSAEGDAAVQIEGLKTKVGGTSTISGSLLLHQTIVFAVKEMINKGFVPTVIGGKNIDRGPEDEKKVEDEYRERYGYRIWLKK
jgi:uncharacterized phosphosugar-binding protein